MFTLCQIFLFPVIFLYPVIFSVVISDSNFIDVNDRDINNEPAFNNEALFLTPYIKSGQIQKGQELSMVSPMLKNIHSFSGYLTVNQTTSSNLFFWLFKSQDDWKRQPLVLWLGGIGGSAIFGLLNEIGPFSVNKNQKLRRRQYSWNRNANLLIIDSPVGNGYSFTKMEDGYAKNEDNVAKDLYEAIIQLYTLFPSLEKNKLIIAGEFYAGKHIPAIAYKIHQMNKVSSTKINIGGLMLGNAWTDPINSLKYSTYLYQLGLVDKTVKDKLSLDEDEIRSDIRSGKYLQAANGFFNELDGITRLTGLKSMFDFVNDDTSYSVGYENKFVTRLVRSDTSIAFKLT